MRRYGGFTLLEMVVAIGIFAIVAAISYASLTQFLAHRAALTQRLGELKELQLAVTLLEHDLRYAVVRPVRDGFGDSEAAMLANDPDRGVSGELFRVTTSQPILTAPGQRLRRVAWRLVDGTLLRTVWDVLDRDQDSGEYARTMLNGVATASLRLLRYDAETGLGELREGLEGAAMPSAAELLLTLDDGREYRRLIEVAAGS
jgi:general secretion pathway protein J